MPLSPRGVILEEQLYRYMSSTPMGPSHRDAKKGPPHSSKHQSSSSGSKKAVKDLHHSSRGAEASSSYSHDSKHRAPGGSSNSSNHHSSSSEELPRSVRNAPPELRLAIRRKQNNESAKRSRERKREEDKEMMRKMKENSAHIDRLEKQVSTLESTLKSKRRPRAKKAGEPSKKGSPSNSCGEYFDPDQPFFGDAF